MTTDDRSEASGADLEGLAGVQPARPVVERLARALYAEFWRDLPDEWPTKQHPPQPLASIDAHAWERIARAALAFLAGGDAEVVRREDVETVVSWLDGWEQATPDEQAACDRLRARLRAGGEGE